jgi:hypothetical protein
MRESSLRWALGLGAIAAAVGVLAAFAGSRFLPSSGTMDINQAVFVLLVAGLFALLALGVSLGLAYYAGLRSEQHRPRAATPVDPDLDPTAERRDSALAGLIVMTLYWICTTLYGVLFGPHTSDSSGNLLIQRLITGVVLLLLGFGLGALGSRAPAARRLLDEISVVPPVAAVTMDRPTPGATNIPAAPSTTSTIESGSSTTPDASAGA